MGPAASLFQRHLPRALHRAVAYRGLQVATDVAYADRPGCSLDLLRPADHDGPLPVVLHVHGGAFRVLSKDTHGHVAARYARAGFLVLNVDYRLAPADPFPAAVRDVHDAWLWALEHLPGLGGDPQRIVIAGESAGANLALGLALSTRVPRPEPWARAAFDAGVSPVGVHPICGFLQASDTARYGRELPVSPVLAWRMPIIEEDYLGRADPGPRAYADPLVMLESLGSNPGLPPMLAPCGTRDPIADDTRRLLTALGRLDAPAEACWVEGAGHGFHVLPGRRSETAWRALIAHARAVADLT
jgi:acetyl esterase